LNATTAPVNHGSFTRASANDVSTDLGLPSRIYRQRSVAYYRGNLHSHAARALPRVAYMCGEKGINRGNQYPRIAILKMLTAIRRLITSLLPVTTIIILGMELRTITGHLTTRFTWAETAENVRTHQ